MTNREHCDSCAYWEATGTEDSGIPSSYDLRVNWVYVVGECSHKSRAGRIYANNIPEWMKACEYWKRKKSRRGRAKRQAGGKANGQAEYQ